MENLQTSSKTISVEDIKKEWKQLWLDRINDKVRAEGVANQTFPLCFVERGTVIAASKDFKPLCLKEILNRNQIKDVEQILGPPPTVGGWHKFARTVLNKQIRNRSIVLKEKQKEKVTKLQPKKSGRGWLHYNIK